MKLIRCSNRCIFKNPRVYHNHRFILITLTNTSIDLNNKPHQIVRIISRIIDSIKKPHKVNSPPSFLYSARQIFILVQNSTVSYSINIYVKNQILMMTQSLVNIAWKSFEFSFVSRKIMLNKTYDINIYRTPLKLSLLNMEAPAMIHLHYTNIYLIVSSCRFIILCFYHDLLLYLLPF